MPRIELRIPQQKELERKLDSDYLVTPEMERALDSIAARPLRAKRSLLGVKRNRVTVTRRAALVRQVTSTARNLGDPDESNPHSAKFNPRVTGASWNAKNLGYMLAMSKNVLRSAFRKIRERAAIPRA